jgi:hypothetical protein
MNAFAQFWGAMLPLRWYMAVLHGQAARGLPLSESARPFAVLAGLAVLVGAVWAGRRFVDELGARAAALENDLALMKGSEFRAITDANHGRVCELPRQESHQTILAA